MFPPAVGLCPCRTPCWEHPPHTTSSPPKHLPASSQIPPLEAFTRYFLKNNNNNKKNPGSRVGGTSVPQHSPFWGSEWRAPIMGIMKHGEELFSIPLPHCASPVGLISENLLSSYYATALSAVDQQHAAVLGGRQTIDKINE